MYLKASILVSLVVAIGIQLASSTTDADFDVMGAMCVYGCIGDHINHTAFRSRSGAGGSPICQHADITQLGEVCHIYNAGKQCLKNECDKGPLVDMVLQVGVYACETHWAEFQKYTPCFTETCPAIENSCQTQCGTIKQAIQYTPEQKKRLEEIKKYSSSVHGNNEESDSDSNSDDGSGHGSGGMPGMGLLDNINLEGVCRYLNCYLNCSEKPLTEKCGPDTYRFLKQVVSDFTPMAFAGIFPNMTTPPEQCKALFSKSAGNAPPTQAGSGWTLGAPSIMILITISLLTVFMKKIE